MNSLFSLVPAFQELWNLWEIHCLILISLCLQVFLFLFAGSRRRSASPVLHTVLWLAYLSADTVAIFVLGHLAVHASQPGHQLMSFWAPFVLVHLGGQETITALSRQDNELWKRHLLSLVSQVGVAGYVVAKASWRDGRLKAAMVLMFISGCFKYAEHILTADAALNSGRVVSLAEDDLLPGILECLCGSLCMHAALPAQLHQATAQHTLGPILVVPPAAPLLFSSSCRTPAPLNLNQPAPVPLRICIASNAPVPTFCVLYRAHLPCLFSFGARTPRFHGWRGWIHPLRRVSKLGGRGEGADNIIVKPGSRNSEELRGRMRVDTDGDVYVPDSEDEESGLQVETVGEGLVDFGGISAAKNGEHIAVGGGPADAIAIGANTVSTDGVDVTAGGMVDVAAEDGTADDVKVAADMRIGEEMHPEVAARPKKVIAHMDPSFRDVFHPVMYSRAGCTQQPFNQLGQRPEISLLEPGNAPPRGPHVWRPPRELLATAPPFSDLASTGPCPRGTELRRGPSSAGVDYGPLAGGEAPQRRHLALRLPLATAHLSSLEPPPQTTNPSAAAAKAAAHGGATKAGDDMRRTRTKTCLRATPRHSTAHAQANPTKRDAKRASSTRQPWRERAWRTRRRTSSRADTAQTRQMTPL
ncbi:hypothetical protein HU200_049841 [Digitaria exilis]|uniref:DUF4220 domain-containing protein n=1 Tax=Digitaria exilis TaxID=1010633 RepID=A0A835AVH4_9POAL|nr:hypothetical protein HU200_049841 [Digitaria exilis]